MPYNIVKFSISDTGIGMTQEQLTELFQPYTQIDSGVNKKYVGTGLGLSICKLLVQLSGGEIYATSKLGRGSTFVFTMKLEHDKNKIYNKYEHAHIGKRICIVDDNAINCMTLDSVLTRFNFVVKTFRSPIDAINHLKLCKLENNEYDLIIMDYYMSHMNGLEAVKQIEEYGIKTGIIMLTSVLLQNRVKFSVLIQYSSLIKYCLYKPIVSKQLYQILIKYFDGIFESNISTDPSHTIQQIHNQETVNNQDSKHVLIVDDNTMNRNIMHIILEKYNYITHDACNGLEAIEKIKENREYYAVFMDIHMPVLNGLDATKKIIESGYTCPIIALTADVTLEMAEKINAVGFYNSIHKPVTVDKILNILNSIKNVPQVVSTPCTADNVVATSDKTSINIIVVDDNNVNTIIFYKYLEMVEEKLGILINKTKFVNGKELCDYYLSDSCSDAVDCIFMDIEMPIMNGYQATIKIKEHDKNIRIVGLTGHEELYYRDLFSGVVLKPISVEAVEYEIQTILNINKNCELEKYINIDIVNGLKNIGEDTINRIINQWCKDLDERKTSIDAKLNNKDLKGIHFDAHYIKGASHQIGCRILGDLFGELEKNALSENFNMVVDIINKINRCYDKSISSIKQVYSYAS
jgi:CheY-like chemotaxis protein